MEKLLLATEEMTALQTQNLTRRWEGQRVIWDGFITNVGESHSVIVVSMEPRSRADALEHIGGIWAQAHFDKSHEGVLSLLRKEQAIRVSCEFDKLFLWNNPILVDCHLVDTIPQPEPTVEPACEGGDCHPEETPDLYKGKEKAA